MKLDQTDSTLTIDLTNKELITLAEYFAPGEIIGLSDPFDGYPEEKKEGEQKQIQQSLMGLGYLEMAENDQWKIDEYLAAFVYSCMHSQNIVFFRNEISSETQYFYFLENWFLCRVDKGEEQQLTLFKSLDDLMDYIFQVINLPKDKDPVSHAETEIGEMEWEDIKKRYFSGDSGSALESLKQNFTEYADPVWLSSILFEPDQDFWIRVVLNANKKDMKEENDYRVFGKGENLFFARYLQRDDAEEKSIVFSQVDHQSLNGELIKIMPAI